MNTYFKNIYFGISTSYQGLRLTIKHFFQAKNQRKNHNISDNQYFLKADGIVTLSYPHELLPLPDHVRHKLEVEMDDCIVCDKCAKVCPVNCIDIEPIKSHEVIGQTSDGTSKRLYAAKFDIDMAKCCYCGLCTTVCPTECITMLPKYDYNVFNIAEMNFPFATLSKEEAEEKKKEYEDKLAIKNAAKMQTEATHTETSKPAQPKIVFKPQIKPSIPIVPKAAEEIEAILPSEAITQDESKTEKPEEPSIKKPVIRPMIPKKP